MEKREFYIDTPAGLLHVYAKHEKDEERNFPGVFVDLVGKNGKDDMMLACTEYESNLGILQTCAYQPGEDCPEQVTAQYVPYEGDEEMEADHA